MIQLNSFWTFTDGTNASAGSDNKSMLLGTVTQMSIVDSQELAINLGGH